MIYDIDGNALTSESDAMQFFYVAGLYQKKTVTNIPNNMAALYALYDAFLSDSRVSKNLIGYGSKADGTADTTLPMYEYVINTPLAYKTDNASRHLPAQPPVILLSSGIHADEKTAIMALYNFVATLFDSTNEIATNLRRTHVFKVVPLCNPWGYDNTTTQNEGRLNARGVNLNRNFSYLWSESTATDKGSAPYSELETQAMQAWLNANTGASFHIDFHNHGASQASRYFYFPADNPKHIKVFSDAFRELTPYFLSEYGIDFKTRNWFIELDNIPGLSAEADNVVGIDSSIIEMPYGISGTVPDNSAIRRETEFAGNVLYRLANYYKIQSVKDEEAST